MNILVAFLSSNRAWVLPRAFVARLRGEFPHHTFLDAWDQPTLDRYVADADVAFTAGIDRAVLASLPRLRWIQSPAAGVGGMMSPELIASPIVVTSARGVRARAIAEHVLGVTIALARQLHVAIRRQGEHRWALDEIEGSPRLMTLKGRRMLVIGLGSVGVEVARLATLFGMHVSGIRRRLDEPRPADLHVDPLGTLERLPALLPESHVVVLATALTPATRGLIGPDSLPHVRPGALLVNIGRGRLIDDDAVIAALQDGRLGGAALDVFTREPLGPDSPYWDLPNVIVTPHVSGSMEDYWTPLVDLFADNLRRYERGDPLVNLVDKHAGY